MMRCSNRHKKLTLIDAPLRLFLGEEVHASVEGKGVETKDDDMMENRLIGGYMVI